MTRRRRPVRTGAAAVALCLMGVGCAPPPAGVAAGPASRPTQQATVVRIVDGDTIHVRPAAGGGLLDGADHTIRLLGYDAREDTTPWTVAGPPPPQRWPC